MCRKDVIRNREPVFPRLRRDAENIVFIGDPGTGTIGSAIGLLREALVSGSVSISFLPGLLPRTCCCLVVSLTAVRFRDFLPFIKKSLTFKIVQPIDDLGLGPQDT